MPPRGTTISSIRMTWCSLGGGWRAFTRDGRRWREKATDRRVARGPKANAAARRVPATRACDGSGRLMGNLKISMTSREQDEERRSGDTRGGHRRGLEGHHPRKHDLVVSRVGGHCRPPGAAPRLALNPGQYVVVLRKRGLGGGTTTRPKPVGDPRCGCAVNLTRRRRDRVFQISRQRGPRATAGPRSPRRKKDLKAAAEFLGLGNGDSWNVAQPRMVSFGLVNEAR